MAIATVILIYSAMLISKKQQHTTDYNYSALKSNKPLF